jgi:hypothetical protein
MGQAQSGWKVVAIHQARGILEENKIITLPIDPWQILELLNKSGHSIELVEEERGGLEGCTLKKNGKSIILLNSRIQNEARKKFTLGHELGHAVLASHTGEISCAASDMGPRAKAQREKEANAFCGELLMPEKLFLKDIAGYSPSIDHILDLADGKYRMSRTATAIRFVELTDTACMLVSSENGEVKWMQRSSRWDKYHELNVLDSRTGAGRYFKTKAVSGEPIRVAADIWFPGEYDDGVTLLEECLVVKEGERILSLLQFAEDF